MWDGREKDSQRSTPRPVMDANPRRKRIKDLQEQIPEHWPVSTEFPTLYFLSFYGFK